MNDTCATHMNKRKRDSRSDHSSSDSTGKRAKTQHSKAAEVATAAKKQANKAAEAARREVSSLNLSELEAVLNDPGKSDLHHQAATTRKNKLKKDQKRKEQRTLERMEVERVQNEIESGLQSVL